MQRSVTIRVYLAAAVSIFPSSSPAILTLPMSSTLLPQIRETIRRHDMPQPPGHLLVALSGGADSVALLLLLREAGYRVTAAHCNFHLRGDESLRDEAFVADLCRRLGVPLCRTAFATAEVARSRGVSVEMAARDLRYEWFGRLCEEIGTEAVAVAHHRDDANETLLLNLARGSGLGGLCGMPYVNGRVIRPLLDVSRADLLRFLEGRGQTFVTDSTNTDTRFKRNLVRHELLPLLRRLNPDIDDTLTATRRRLTEERRLCEAARNAEEQRVMRPVPGGADIDLAALLASPAPLTLLTQIMGRYGFTPAMVGMMFHHIDGRTGAIHESPTHQAVRHRGVLQIRPLRPPAEAVTLPDEGTLTWQGRTLTWQFEAACPLSDLPCIPTAVCLDADRLYFPLTLRGVRKGDRFVPFGMRGSQLVSDYLTNRHRSVLEKRQAAVLCDAEGIVWLVGERPADRAAVTAGSKRLLRITLR